MKHLHRTLASACRTLRYLQLLLSIIAAAGAAGVIPATAADLPKASTFVQCFAAGNNSFHSTECHQGGFPGVPPSAFASATMSPYPSASVEVTAPPSAVLGAGADSNATYWFQVKGGNVGDTVPIQVDFSLSVFSTPESSALARLIIRTSVQPFLVEELVCNPQSCDDSELSDTLTIQSRSGAAPDSVTLYVLASAPATRISHETARAFADPYLYVDPKFPNANLYSIVVSPGVGNVPVSQVPAPPPAMLWLAGSVLIAFRLVRQKVFPA